MLHIHRAERADGLVAGLRDLLLEPLADPFMSEVVAVPTRGMERWVAQRLSADLGATAGRRDGVCANVIFPPPHRMLADVVASAAGVDPDGDPWLAERAMWPLLEVIEDCLGEPWLHALAMHLGCTSDPPDPVRRTRRLSTAQHLAELFERYALNRPEMVGAWAIGQDSDGNGAPLPAAAVWQAELWRRLRERIATPGPAERLASACATLRDDPAVIDLPLRVSLFGLTRVPAGQLQVLQALAGARDVHLFLLHPSPVLWDALAHGPQAPGPGRRRHDNGAQLPANRLLASWGRDAREMQLVLLAQRTPHVDHHHPVQFESETLLRRIQDDVRGDHPPPGVPFSGAHDRRAILHPADRSLQIHSCHGRARQVEVVRDAVLHMLAEDPTLEPRDVIIMCPDIETFAPLIHATFGAGELTAHEDGEAAASTELRPVNLRVRLADRSLRQTNPLFAFIAHLLELADQRLTASQVLDLADREPVRRRFGFDDRDLTRLHNWVGDAAIRWGLDAAHRAPFGLGQLPTGTWRSGLDRLMLGVTMTEDGDRLFADVLPVDDVESGAIDLAGRFAELIARLGQAIDMCAAAQAVEDWASLLALAVDSLTLTRERDAWQRSAVQRVLDDLVAQTDGSAVRLALPELRALLGERLQGRPTRTNFRTGHLTVCTLHPMRSVPHRVVCLLGLDDGAFPRKAPRDGDDLMLDAPRIGERDPRSEDRQLLLDALLAATDRLIVTYTGNDERTNIPRPPAVPVGELLDAIDATARCEDGPARARIVVRHPLQPFDPRNFAFGNLVANMTWSFDPVALEGARALTSPRTERGPFLSEPLPALETQVVELEDLVRFAQHPVRSFLRQRLRINLAEISEETEDALRIELDGLQRWGIGQRLLDARLAGVAGRSAILAEIARGTLPPGVLGQPVITEIYRIVDAIVDATASFAQPGAAREPVDVRATLADGRLLNGTVAGVSGDVLLTVTYSKVSAKHRVAAWVRLLALTAAHPERTFSAATIGRSGADADVSIACISALGPDAESRRRSAAEHLTVLVDLYDRGMREPLPLYCLSSAAYAEAVLGGADPLAAAGQAWTSRWMFGGEDEDLDHQLVLGGVRTLDELLEEPPRADEQGPGWDISESTRVGRCAVRMWRGLLAHEQVTHR